MIFYTNSSESNTQQSKDSNQVQLGMQSGQNWAVHFNGKVPLPWLTY